VSDPRRKVPANLIFDRWKVWEHDPNVTPKQKSKSVITRHFRMGHYLKMCYWISDLRRLTSNLEVRPDLSASVD
jgi:hypothetical protein